MGSLFILGEPPGWGSVRGVSVPQYLPEVHSERSFCFLEHPHTPGTVESPGRTVRKRAGGGGGEQGCGRGHIINNPSING